MAEMYQRTSKKIIPDSNRDVEVEQTTVERTDTDAPVTKAQQVVQFITGVIVSLLGLRFLLALFGANSANPIVNFVYDVTAPLIAPFKALFANPNIEEVARFEVETLLAIVGYLLISVLVIKLIDLFRNN